MAFSTDQQDSLSPLKTPAGESETRERVKITPREKGETRRGEFSPPRLSFLEWGDFHARSRFARSIIPEEKWGLLVV